MNINHKRRLILTATAAGAMGTLAAGVFALPQERIVTVSAKKFTFTPGEIHLQRSVPVVIELTTLDVAMGFNVPDFGVRADILPGRTSRVRFTPDKAGEFPFHCDLFCGSGHEDMHGVITVS